MVRKKNILNTITTLEKYYNKARLPKEQYFYSKLAILELCGWIEETMDEIINQCARRNLKDSQNIDYVGQNIVERTYGFKYENNFRIMLMRLIGIINLETLENKLDRRTLIKLKTTLGNLKAERDDMAHTHIKGTTIRISAPSLTKTYFLRVYQGLIEFEKGLKYF